MIINNLMFDFTVMQNSENMQDFKHFIITRFNLRTSNTKWKEDKDGNPVLDKNWMLYRIEIFKKYCLPSVINQSNKNFIWLICLDTETHNEFKTFFLDLQKEYNFIIPLFINGMRNFNGIYKKYVIDQTKEVDYVITSRLDNDDIVHKDYIKKIQEQFNFQTYMAINFLKILMISTTNENKLHIDYSFSNHFISLIEQLNENEFKGCYSKKDISWNCKGEIIQLAGKPYVMETINDKNLLNQFRGFPIIKKTYLKDFGLNKMYNNNFFDKDNFRFHKMSWRKLVVYINQSKLFSNSRSKG